MKLLKKFKFIILALFSILSVSCLDDSVTDFGKGPIVVQFPSATQSQNFLQDGSGTVYDFEIPVQYFGQDNNPLSKDVTLTVGVNTSKSTATEGTEFSLPITSFTIPAGSNTTKVSIKVNSANLDSQNPKVLALEILNSSEKTSSNKNIILLTLQAICPSSLEGNWQYTDGNGRTTVIASTGSGTYSIDTDNYFRGRYPIFISDVCNNLTVTGGFLQDNFGIAVSGTGTVSADGSSMTISYTADGYFANRSMTLTKQ